MQRTLPACIARPFAVSQLSGPFDFQPLATKQTSLSLVSSQFSRQFSNKSGVWSPGGRRHYTIFLPSGVHIKPNPKSNPKTNHNPNPKLRYFFLGLGLGFWLVLGFVLVMYFVGSVFCSYPLLFSALSITY